MAEAWKLKLKEARDVALEAAPTLRKRVATGAFQRRHCGAR